MSATNGPGPGGAGTGRGDRPAVDTSAGTARS